MTRKATDVYQVFDISVLACGVVNVVIGCRDWLTAEGEEFLRHAI